GNREIRSRRIHGWEGRHSEITGDRPGWKGVQQCGCVRQAIGTKSGGIRAPDAGRVPQPDSFKCQKGTKVRSQLKAKPGCMQSIVTVLRVAPCSRPIGRSYSHGSCCAFDLAPFSRNSIRCCLHVTTPPGSLQACKRTQVLGAKELSAARS